MSKVVKKTTKARLSVFGTLSLIIIIYFGITLCFHFYTIYNLRVDKKNLEKKYQSLVIEADDLQSEIKKLSDPEYLARYAREKYSYSKDGEYIIKMNDVKEEIESIDETLNNNYIVIGLSCVIFFVFMYIIFKSRKKEI